MGAVMVAALKTSLALPLIISAIQNTQRREENGGLRAGCQEHPVFARAPHCLCYLKILLGEYKDRK